jgi:hypothetical protein
LALFYDSQAYASALVFESHHHLIRFDSFIKIKLFTPVCRLQTTQRHSTANHHQSPNRLSAAVDNSPTPTANENGRRRSETTMDESVTMDMTSPTTPAMTASISTSNLEHQPLKQSKIQFQCTIPELKTLMESRGPDSLLKVK